MSDREGTAAADVRFPDGEYLTYAEAAKGYEPVVLIRPDAGPFVFNTEERGTDEALDEACAFADQLRAVIQKWLPWNQVAMGAFAWVELREIDQ